MRRFNPKTLLVVAALALLAASGEADDDFDDGMITMIEYPDWFKESFLNLQDDLADAREAGKDGLLLFFSSQGCSYCHLFIRTSLADPTLAGRVQAHFDTIGLEIFDDADLTDLGGNATRVKHFALDQGVEFSPTLLFLDGEGRAVLRLAGYYDPERFGRALDYVIGRHYEDEPFKSWLARQEISAPPKDGDRLIADPLFSEPPYALERKRMPAQRPLLVIFERAGCPRCAQFHRKVLQDSDVRSILEGMEVIRLDAADTQTPVVTPSGERITPAGWAQQQGFTQYPALVFFEEGGEQVLETDALVLKSRMLNALGFVTERAYEQGWTYQRFARTRGLAQSAAAREQGGQ
jgi:thioredoxin-related protein